MGRLPVTCSLDPAWSITICSSLFGYFCSLFGLFSCFYDFGDDVWHSHAGKVYITGHRCIAEPFNLNGQFIGAAIKSFSSFSGEYTVAYDCFFF